jgi:hypothetical protein
MRALIWSIVLVASCGGGKPKAESPEPAASTSTPVASAAPEPATSASAAAPAEPAKPEFEPTPADQLKKVSKADVTAAAKLVKADDAWDSAIAAVQKKLGPPTYIANPVDADKPFAATYYWSAMKAGGGCDKLWVQQSADKKKVLDLGTKAVGKDESTFPDKGGKPIDPCTGLPKK